MAIKKLFPTINFPFVLQPWIDPAIGNSIATHAEEVEQVALWYRKRVTELKESKEYSEIGERAQRERLGAEVDNKLNEMEAKARQGLTAKIKAAEDKMQPNVAKWDGPAVFRDELKRQEIRQYAATMAPGDTDAYYKDAVERGDDLIADAIEQDPTRRIKFRDPKLIDEQKFKRLSHKFPEAAAEHRAYTHVLSEVLSAYGHGRTALKNVGLILPSLDPLHDVGTLGATDVGSSNAPARRTKGEGAPLPA